MRNLGESASLAAYLDAEDRQIAKEKRWEEMADEKQADFRKIALERMYDPDYDLDGELADHCLGPMFRRVMWMAFDGAEHPYRQDGGEQVWRDDLGTIREQVNGWLAEQEAKAREEFLAHCAEVDA